MYKLYVHVRKNLSQVFGGEEEEKDSKLVWLISLLVDSRHLFPLLILQILGANGLVVVVVVPLLFL